MARIKLWTLANGQVLDFVERPRTIAGALMEDEMTRIEIDKEIKKIEPNIEPGSESFWAYRVLITAPVVGPNNDAKDFQEKVEKFWKVKPGRLKTMCYRATRNKVVRYGSRNQKKFLEGEIYNDTLGLAIGVDILLGYIRKVKN